MSTISTNNYTIGGVDLYYCATIADDKLDKGTLNGVGSDFRETVRSLGNIVTAEWNPDITYLEHFIVASGGDRRRDHIIMQNRSLTIPFTFDEMNETNLRKFFIGDDVSASAANSTPVFKVMTNTLEYGSAQLYFRTDIGQDMVYMIPKAAIRPEGAMAMNIEDWWTGPMALDILYYATWTASNLTGGDNDVVAPYGIVSVKSI